MIEYHDITEELNNLYAQFKKETGLINDNDFRLWMLRNIDFNNIRNLKFKETK